ncbi:alpha-L-fucosidase [Flavobacterium sp. CF108]|uniref:sialidase family protein n=1 Tax=unclassified Flavobacterium TaxID=196869 RepID=UPI0008B6D65A|nr:MULTISPECIES: sialidase family protein [unclassified Flavobacterium]SEO97440.1 Predicted neuraminidase (sialidase) [Flavobacterium sp. fv08]SHH80612.1 alpha-L-fucosidase [Flavobacterium sp. CF108]
MNLKKYGAIVLLVSVFLACKSIKNEPKTVNITQNYIAANPVTTASHASTLAELENNTLLAAWFGGKYEGAKDVSIYISSYKEKKWSAPKKLIEPLVKDGDTLPCWNPVLFKSKSQNLYLFYKVGKNPREWFGAMIVSKDDGKSWSNPKYLPKGILGPIRNKPIETTPGIILCGSSTESIDDNKWRVFIETYTEASDSWTIVDIYDKKNFDIIQPTFLIHSDNEIQILSRSRHNKLISSWSEDNGKTWQKTDSINVVNSNSGVDAVTLSNKSFLLVNNPLKMGKDWFNGRNVLDVEYSKDGVNWKKIFDLENQPEGEFSYPAIIQTSDKKVHILYTYNRKFIKHTTFDLK